MEAVSEQEENVFEQLEVVERVEGFSEALVFVHLFHDRTQGVHSDLALGVGVVFQGPDYALNECLEGLFGNVEEDFEAVLNHALNQYKEVLSGLDVGNEVLCYHWKGGLQNHRNHLGVKRSQMVSEHLQTDREKDQILGLSHLGHLLYVEFKRKGYVLFVFVDELFVVGVIYTLEQRLK